MSFVGKWFGFGKDQGFDDGLRAYERQAFQEAIENFRLSVESGKDRAVRERSKSYLAGCLGKLAAQATQNRDFESALQLYQEGVSVRPGFADLWYGLGRTHLTLGDAQNAIEAAEQALELNPNFGSAGLLKGMALYKNGDTDEGFKLIELAVQKDPRLATEDFKLAQTLHNAQKTDQAYEALKEVRPAPSHVHDLIGTGNQASKQGDWQTAETAYRAALELAPHYADIAVLLGQTLMEQSRLPEAVQSFNLALQTNPEYAEAHALLGITYRRLDQEPEAMTAFRRALELDPDHPIASQEVLYKRTF